MFIAIETRQSKYRHRCVLQQQQSISLDLARGSEKKTEERVGSSPYREPIKATIVIVAFNSNRPSALTWPENRKLKRGSGVSSRTKQIKAKQSHVDVDEAESATAATRATGGPAVRLLRAARRVADDVFGLWDREVLQRRVPDRGMARS